MKRLSVIFVFIFLVHCGTIPERPEQFNEATATSASSDEKGTLHFRFIDVGQGDATLITTPSGKQILIDAGTEEMGNEHVLSLINDNFELIIASHYDADHIGGIPEILREHIPSQGLLDRGNIEGIDTADLSNYFIAAATHRWHASVGESSTIDGVMITIIGQNGQFSNGTVIEVDPDNENAHSISLLIEYNGIRYLTSGDLPGPNFENEYEPVDLESIVADIVGDIDILHVSHHGSHQSTNLSFLEVIKPEYAIISVGENSYGHPSDVVLENLNNANAETLITDGDVCMEFGEGIALVACD